MESAIDELSYALGIDPIGLRVKNHAHVHPNSGLPWSSNALLDCYRQGAERFGWSARIHSRGRCATGDSLSDTAWHEAPWAPINPPCKAIASDTARWNGLRAQRRDRYRSGPYTVMTMLAADCLGVPDRARAVRSR